MKKGSPFSKSQNRNSKYVWRAGVRHTGLVFLAGDDADALFSSKGRRGHDLIEAAVRSSGGFWAVNVSPVL